MRNLTVTYRKFDHLSQFTPTQLKRLRKLSFGDNGCMAPTIDLHVDGYVVDEYGESITPAEARGYGDDADFSIDFDAFGLNRHIMVAYVGKAMVGWTVTDREKMFNVFVSPKYRKLGIAQKLTELWAARNVNVLKKVANARQRNWDEPIFDVVHTSEAAKLMKIAMHKLGIHAKNAKKFRKVTHRVVG